jgi:hypothetical protein
MRLEVEVEGQVSLWGELVKTLSLIGPAGRPSCLR